MQSETQARVALPVLHRGYLCTKAPRNPKGPLIPDGLTTLLCRNAGNHCCALVQVARPQRARFPPGGITQEEPDDVRSVSLVTPLACLFFNVGYCAAGSSPDLHPSISWARRSCTRLRHLCKRYQCCDTVLCHTSRHYFVTTLRRCLRQVEFT